MENLIVCCVIFCSTQIFCINNMAVTHHMVINLANLELHDGIPCGPPGGVYNVFRILRALVFRSTALRLPQIV